MRNVAIKQTRQRLELRLQIPSRSSQKLRVPEQWTDKDPLPRGDPGQADRAKSTYLSSGLKHTLLLEKILNMAILPVEDQIIFPAKCIGCSLSETAILPVKEQIIISEG